MRLTIAILASLLFIANTAVSNANIIFTPVITSSTFGGPPGLLGLPSQQTIVMSLRLTGNNDLVNQFGFRATLSTAVGPAISFVNPATPITVTPTTPAFEFGGEFTHAPAAVTVANGVDFSGTNAPLFNISFGPTFGTPHNRERQITFTINRPAVVNQTLNVAFTAANIPGTALSGFVNLNGQAVPTNFTSVGLANAISAVPEPSSMALIALVGGAVVGVRFRTRKAKKAV